MTAGPAPHVEHRPASAVEDGGIGSVDRRKPATHGQRAAHPGLVSQHGVKGLDRRESPAVQVHSGDRGRQDRHATDRRSARWRAPLRSTNSRAGACAHRAHLAVTEPAARAACAGATRLRRGAGGSERVHAAQWGSCRSDRNGGHDRHTDGRDATHRPVAVHGSGTGRLEAPAPQPRRRRRAGADLDGHALGTRDGPGPGARRCRRARPQWALRSGNALRADVDQ